jgi:class 3 adenylate cyclase/predicted ATPase
MMTDLKSWLTDLGLPQYAATLADHAVDWDVLPDLSEKDLADIGIPLGHRKRLLKAISLLVSPYGAGGTQGHAESTSAQPVPERRHLTVVFCDLVGSTALSRRLDPEDLRPILRAYQDCCAGIVARMDGFLCRYVGDGILTYFGYPRAHEDDAERALRAALEIIDAVGRLPIKGGERLKTRIGITTGLVVVGELIGRGLAQEVAAIGDAPNIAAHLQAIAAPDSVIVDHATYQLTSGLFEYVDLGVQTLKGASEKVQAYRVVGESNRESRFEALRGPRLVPFQDRTDEIPFLLARWKLAKKGAGQVVLVSGEPGVGKSRLIQALEVKLAGDPHRALHCYSSPYHQSTVLYPFVDQVRRAARLATDDSVTEKLNKIAAHFSGSATRLDEAVEVFAALLSLPLSDPASQELNLQSAKEAALTLFVEHLAHLATEQPLLLLIEDAHWLDPTSLELLDMLAGRVPSMRILLLITYRSDASLSLRNLPQASEIKLNRLRPRDCKSIVQHLAERKSVPATLVDAIVARADGVALFVEELTKAVLESEIVVDRGDRYEMTTNAPALAIPTTLKGSLMSRLDRNPAIREVAQIASVIGREFSLEMISAASDWPEALLCEALDRLVESEILHRVGVPGQAVFRFRHALVQDAAYESLLHSARRQLHARMGEIIESRFPDTAASEPMLVAHHFARAALPERAIDYCLKAATFAFARSAMAEAIAALRTGLSLLPDLPSGVDPRSRELQLQVMLASALRAARAPSAPETGQAWDRARALCDNQNSAALLQILYGQFLFHQGNGNLAEARRIGEELLALSQQLDSSRALVRGHSAIGRTAFGQGDFTSASYHLEKALAVDDVAWRAGASSIEGPESRVLDLCYLSWTLFIQGLGDQALERCRQSIALASELAQPYDLVVAHGNACYLHHFRRDRDAVAQCADKVIMLASEQGFPAWLSLGNIFRGWALVRQGNSERGFPLIEEALADHMSTGERLEVPYLMSLLVECLAGRGDMQNALARLGGAVALARSTGEAWYDAELYRLEGELLLGASPADVDRPAQRFVEALELARRQNARIWELRASVSLARLMLAIGKREESRRLIEPLLAGFAQDANPTDREEAQRVLTECLC